MNTNDDDVYGDIPSFDNSSRSSSPRVGSYSPASPSASSLAADPLRNSRSPQGSPRYTQNSSQFSGQQQLRQEEDPQYSSRSRYSSSSTAYRDDSSHSNSQHHHHHYHSHHDERRSHNRSRSHSRSRDKDRHSHSYRDKEAHDHSYSRDRESYKYSHSRGRDSGYDRGHDRDHHHHHHNYEHSIDSDHGRTRPPQHYESESRPRHERYSELDWKRVKTSNMDMTPRDGEVIEKIDMSDDDVRFVIGRKETGKERVCRVAKVRMHVSDQEVHDSDGGAANKLVLSVVGAPENVQRARRYINLIRQQRSGKVVLTDKDAVEVEIITIPSSLVGFVTGTNGATLQGIEDKHDAIALFVDDCRSSTLAIEAKDDPARKGGKKDGVLAIFGMPRARYATELEIMIMVEKKRPGWYTSKMRPYKETRDVEYGMDIIDISNAYSYILGPGGTTKLKLMLAAECVMECIMPYAFVAGTAAQRERCRDYIEVLRAQALSGNSSSANFNISGRKDVDRVIIPAPAVGYVTGKRGDSLRNIEALSNTFCFIQKIDPSDNSDMDKALYICSGSHEAREKAHREVIRIMECFKRASDPSAPPRERYLSSSFSSSAPYTSSSSSSYRQSDDRGSTRYTHDRRRDEDTSRSRGGDSYYSSTKEHSSRKRSRSRSRSRSGSRSSRPYKKSHY